MELTKEEKLFIANEELKSYIGLHYRHQLRARGHKAAGNDAGVKAAASELAVIEGILDEIRAEIEALKNDNAIKPV